MEAESVPLDEPEYHEIHTERLRLRTLRTTDAEAMMPILSREEVMRWTSHGAMSNISQAERWLRDRALGKDTFNFAIELKDDVSKSSKPPIMGVVGTFHLPEVGYMLHPDHFGKGYATEAFKAFLAEFFDHHPPQNEDGSGLDHVEGWTDIQNWPSRRILEKCGFTYCETIPDPDNAIRGPSELVIYRKARPGKTLEELGLLPPRITDDRSAAPTPPIQ